LKKRKLELEGKLKKERIGGKQITAIQEKARKLALGLEKAENNFEYRRRLIELLNVQAILYYENDEERVVATCEPGELEESPAEKTMRGVKHSSRAMPPTRRLPRRWASCCATPASGSFSSSRRSTDGILPGCEGSRSAACRQRGRSLMIRR
jgi:hypothetical protein